MGPHHARLRERGSLAASVGRLGQGRLPGEGLLLLALAVGLPCRKLGLGGAVLRLLGGCGVLSLCWHLLHKALLRVNLGLGPVDLGGQGLGLSIHALLGQGRLHCLLGLLGLLRLLGIGLGGGLGCSRACLGGWGGLGHACCGCACCPDGCRMGGFVVTPCSSR